ncbi:GntR family transcriptional regulator [Microvirga antarctica]|uniref:GntR family transcriptional regulator n=1 Tax=Microvirga antarctica TaxID=2819233 RepID=UPI001B317B3E|nr:GntR family transcriptional regulator [Microvirga antarctica]
MRLHDRPPAFTWNSQARLLDEVADVLRERIYAGTYRPGDVLRQESLATEFGISRTPLREALRVLERDGLVHHQAGRGVKVASADRARLLDAYALREVVDGLAARFAAERADRATIEALDGLVARQVEIVAPWEPRVYTQSNVDFHLAVIAAARNEFLDTHIPLVRMTSQVFTPAYSLSLDRALQGIGEHRHIVEAIAAGDGAAAERLARAHIRETMTRLTRDVPTGEETS